MRKKHKAFTRAITIAMSILFILTVFSPVALAYSPKTLQQCTISSDRATADVVVGKKCKTTFTATIGKNAGEKISLLDSRGNKVADMNDSGAFGDLLAHDGIYSVSTELFSDMPEERVYSVCSDSDIVSEYSVNFYRELSENDYSLQAEVNSNIEGIKKVFESNDRSFSDIIDAAENYLMQNDGVAYVTKESDSTVSYTMKSGIKAVYTLFNPDEKGSEGTSELKAFSEEGEFVALSDTRSDEVTTYSNPNVLLVRPFRNNPDEPGFANERYKGIAKGLSEMTGGVLTVLDDSETIPYNLLTNFYKNGFVFVDSHGIDVSGSSYILVARGKGYNSADLSAGRVLVANSDLMCVTGTYFQAHYEEDNISFDKTLFYFGICLGMKFPSLCDPLMELGAVAVMGYNESVTFGYDARMIVAIFDHLMSECKEDNTRSYNIEESIQHAFDTVGEIDIYNDIAELKLKGDKNFVTYASDVYVEGISFEQQQYNSSIQNVGYVKPDIEPKNAFGYTQKWESEDEDIVKVMGPRLLLGVGEGTTKVTCTVIDEIDGEEKEFKAEFDVRVSVMHIVSFEVSIETGNRFSVGQTKSIKVDILPYNASNQEVTFLSNNPGSVAVDDEGTVSALLPGTATIYCYVYGEGLVRSISITVDRNNVFHQENEAVTGNRYCIIARNKGLAVTSTVEEGKLVATKATVSDTKYITSSVSQRMIWYFNKEQEGFTISNKEANLYLAQTGTEGNATIKGEKGDVFSYYSGRLVALNTCNMDKTALRLSDERVSYASQSVASTFDLYRCIEYSDAEKFKTVTFTDYDNKVIATQTVAVGSKAIAAIPSERAGYTFLGWNGSLGRINEDTTVKALYRAGTTDKIIVTFMNKDAEVIKAVEINSGDNVTAPKPTEYEGFKFVGWSEALKNITQNMTVFAMYEIDREMGDVNDDKAVNTGDVTMILRYLVGKTELDETSVNFADVTKDGKINTGDATALLKQIIS